MGLNSSGYQMPNSFSFCEEVTPQVLNRYSEGSFDSFMNQNGNVQSPQKKFIMAVSHSGYHRYRNPTLGADVLVSFRILPCVSIRLTRFLENPGSTTKRGPAHL
ncbi:MAG TPA: hypothetical protein DD706_01260 [Nitrospiraceae bacterium]|nr:hypothetical protein [Nitrospiraceae bacterium]